MARSFSGSSPENLEEREIRTRNKIRPFQTIRAPGFGGKYTERRFLFENFEDATAQKPEFLRFPEKWHSLSSNGVYETLLPARGAPLCCGRKTGHGIETELRSLMDLGLKDKVAVITGASIGIGLAVAEGLAAEGAHLVMVARQRERLQSEAERLADKFGVKTTPVFSDVATVAGIEEIVASIKSSFGGADILINNAGTGSNETVMDAPDEKWQFYWDLHVMAAVRLARGLVPFMRQRGGGVILHNASICAIQPLWYEPIYNVTKAALMMFSKTLSLELVKDNIRVNTINPGLILTPDWIKTAKQLTADKGGDWQGYLDGIAKEHAPIARFATPQELANFFVFLCSDRASYSVGSAYFVDGGMLKVVT